MGALNEARARIALLANDPALAADYLQKMEDWYHPTGIPTLMQRCARLAKELRAQTGQDVVAGTYDTVYATNSIERLFSEVMGVTQCAERVLTLITEPEGEGYLFLPESERLRLVARTQSRSPDAALIAWVEARVQSAMENQNTVVMEDPDSVAHANLFSSGETTYQLTILYAADAYRDVVTAAAVIARGAQKPGLQGAALNALAMQLYKTMGAQ
jgi:hypothetical protein